MADFYDYIIVGAGAAGCVLSGELSANPKTRVLLLEAGGKANSFWVNMPLGYGKTFTDKRLNYCLESMPDEALGDRTSYVPRGKGFGGSTSINAMVYMRGLPHDFDDWVKAGATGWDWSHMKPVYDALEKRNYDNGKTSGTGDLAVNYSTRDYHKIGDAFNAAMEELGVEAKADVNGGDEAFGAYPIMTENGRRVSSADAFLRPHLRRQNLHVETEAQVTRLVIQNGVATGVEYEQNGVQISAKAREIILSAGAIHTPQILQVSGIGDAQHLSEIGVDTIVHNPNVGAHLQDHLGINYYYEAKIPTLNQELGTVLGQVKAGLKYVLTKSGPLSLSVNQFGGLVRSHADAPVPNLQLYMNPMSYQLQTGARRKMTRPDPYPGFILSFNPCRPTSRGFVKAKSADMRDAPEIKYNFLSTAHDEEEAILGAKFIARVDATAAIQNVMKERRGFTPVGASDDEILEDFRARSGSVFHASCTARIAKSAEDGVVDQKLRVFGVSGLRVVDASVFPNVTSANTTAPTIAVAKRALEFLRV